MLVASERGRILLDDVIADDDAVAIAAVTAAELMTGVELSVGLRRARRRTFVEQVLAAIPTEDYGLDVAIVHARLLAATRESGRPRGAHDLLVSATAVATGRVVVTLDCSGFEDLPGVQLRIASRRSG